MRSLALGGIVCLAMAGLGQGGDKSPAGGYKELSVADLESLMGSWEAVVHTPTGWRGTLRASVSPRHDHPEASTFHAGLAIRYDLKFADRQPAPAASGSVKVALIPFQRDKQRSLQCWREYQVLQREFYLETLENNSADKNAQKALAAMRPTPHDTAPFWLNGNTWTMDVPPSLKEILPQAPKGAPRIDWDDRIVWKKAKAK